MIINKGVGLTMTTPAGPGPGYVSNLDLAARSLAALATDRRRKQRHSAKGVRTGALPPTFPFIPISSRSLNVDPPPCAAPQQPLCNHVVALRGLGALKFTADDVVSASAVPPAPADAAEMQGYLPIHNSNPILTPNPMRSRLPLLTTMVAVHAFATQPVARTRIEREALCIESGCTTYAATITAFTRAVKPREPAAATNTIGPRGEIVVDGAYASPIRVSATFRVDAVYCGPLKPGETVVRDYVEPSSEDLSFGDAWQDVVLQIGERVLLMEQRGDHRIVAAEREASGAAAEIRTLTAFHSRVLRNAQILLDEIARFRLEANPIEAAYLLAVIPNRLSAPDAADAFLVLMFKNGFTPKQRSAMALNVGRFLIAPSNSGNIQKYTERLVSLATLPDTAKANSAFVALSILAWHDGHLPVSSSAARRLLNSYEAVLSAGYQRDKNLETLLRERAGAK